MLAKDPLFWLAAVASLAVLAILLLGIGSFAKGGEFHRRHANRIMRYRLAAQALAVALIVLFTWLRARGS